METKRKIMDDAFKLFAEKGTEFSLNEVARGVGIQKASIYAHFASKEDLLYAMIDREIDEYFYEINEQCHDLKSIFLMIINYYNQSQEKLYFWKRLFLFAPKAFEKTLSTKIKMLSEQRYDIVKKIIVRNMEEDIIRRQDPDTVALFYFSMIHGLSSSIVIYHPENLSIYYEGIWDIFWNGIK